MSFLKSAITLVLEWTVLIPSGLNPFHHDDVVSLGDSVQQMLKLGHGLQVPIEDDGFAGVHFHPEGASKGFECRYPSLKTRQWKACNQANSRDCWLKEKHGKRIYNIKTDYEEPNDVPTGIVREYWIEAKETLLSPDGAPYPNHALTFNGTYPGPRIEACWGDELVVHVTNHISDQGTTVHWHGVRQLYTNQMDGVPLTQCPIARNNSFTYRFKALQYGTSWAHSHYSLQYPEGLAAPLIFYGPSSADYDEAPEPLLLADWVHGNISQRYIQEEEPGRRPAAADSILLNGRGRLANATAAAKSIDAYTVITVKAGKKHLLRLINGSAGTTFVFSIDQHSLTIVATDFVSIIPYTVTSLVIGIGQRYTVVVQGLADPIAADKTGNFWIRTHPADGCNNFTNGQFDSQSSPSEPFDVRTGILHYNVVGTTTATPANGKSNEPRTLACLDVLSKHLKPVVPWIVNHNSLNDLAASHFYAAHQTIPDVTLGPNGNYTHWLLRLAPKVELKIGRQMRSPFWIDYSNPTLLNLSKAGLDPHYSVVNYTFPEAQENFFIFMIIDASGLVPLSDNQFVVPVTHPIHWHGSDVVILGQSTAPFDSQKSPQTWDYDNPTRRDVILVPGGGYAAVAFKPDNPGVWLVHCHIAWHASAGLALQMLIEQDQIHQSLGEDAFENAERQCQAWERDLEKAKEGQAIEAQIDGGI